MRLQAHLKGVGALAQDKTVKAGSEVSVHFELLLVFFEIHLPEFKCNLVAIRRILGLRWVHKGQILQTFFQLGGVAFVRETHMSNQFPHGSNVLLRGPFSCIVEYVTVHCGLTTGERGLLVPVAGPVVPVVTSSAPPTSALRVTTTSSISVTWSVIPRRSVASFLTTWATFRLHGCSTVGLLNLC